MSILTKAQLDELLQFDVPTVCNALERFDIRPRTAGFAKPGISRRTPTETPMIGYASTVKIGATHPKPVLLIC